MAWPSGKDSSFSVRYFKVLITLPGDVIIGFNLPSEITLQWVVMSILTFSCRCVVCQKVRLSLESIFARICRYLTCRNVKGALVFLGPGSP